MFASAFVCVGALVCMLANAFCTKAAIQKIKKTANEATLMVRNVDGGIS